MKSLLLDLVQMLQKQNKQLQDKNNLINLMLVLFKYQVEEIHQLFLNKKRSWKRVLTVKNISKSYDGNVVLDNINFTVEKGDKIALIGTNGIGKTTLCEILEGNLQPDSGEVLWGATIQNSYFPQNATDIIEGDITLYDWLRNCDRDADISEIRNCLGRMLFNGQEQEKKVNSCSGEKNIE